MVLLTNYTMEENAQLGPSNIPLCKRRKVSAVRTYPEGFKRPTTHISRPTNESTMVNNLSSKNDSVCDQEDDSLEPFEHDDLQSQENSISTQMHHILSDDLESKKVEREFDVKTICQSETQDRENFPKVPVIRDFPKAFDQIFWKINSAPNEDLKSEGSFESCGNCRENFVHKETKDIISKELESERSNSLDNEESHDGFGDKSANFLPNRRVPVIRFFPPRCGTNVHISDDDHVKIRAKEPFFEGESNTYQVRVEALDEEY